MNLTGARPPLRLPDPKALSSVLGAEQEVGVGQPHSSPTEDTVFCKLA